MSRVTLNAITRAAESRGLAVRLIDDHGEGHSQSKIEIAGSLRVHYWPWSRKRTAYVLATMAGHAHCDIDRVCELATEPPPVQRDPAARRQRIAQKWKRRRFKQAREAGQKGVACRWCGAMLTQGEATVDHVIPLKRGGLDNPNNFAVACRSCNRERGHDMPELRERCEQ